MDYPRVIAHRCGGALAPENSLAGLAAAARIGCRGVEFDTMLAADGVPVLMHDDTVDRTTNGHGEVAALTSTELRALDLGGESVPLLTEALEHCAALGLWANVELKPPRGREAQLGQAVGRLLATHWNGHGVISSFSEAALAAARREAPGFAYAMLVEKLPPDWQERARRLGVVAVHCAARHADAAVIAAIRAAGLAVACYTVNRITAAERLLGAGVAGVFTDRPDLWPAEQMQAPDWNEA
jgi:glycerophosphoryl diester phosphodiesterase